MAINVEAAEYAVGAAAKILREAGAAEAAARLLGDTRTATPLAAHLAEGMQPVLSNRVTDALSMRGLIQQDALPTGLHLPELTSKGDPATHITQATSMRAMVQQGRADTVERYINDHYFPQLQRVFPANEIESPTRYMDYLTKPNGTWDMIALRNPEHEVLGGIQKQNIAVNAETIGTATWGEHVWLRQEARNQPNFVKLIGTTRQSVKESGANHLFMEYNDPLKMSAEEIEEDLRTGIAPQRRVNLWNRVGIHVAVGEDGKPFIYGQPTMEGMKDSHGRVIDKLTDLNAIVERQRIAYRAGQPELSDQAYDALKTYRDRVQRVADKISENRVEGGVNFLSLGHIRGTPLSGIGADGRPFNATMPMLDTLKLQHAAHRTIDGVRIPDTLIPDLVRAHADGNLLQGVKKYQGIADPTVLNYTAESIGTGTKTLKFVKLGDIYGPLFRE